MQRTRFVNRECPVAQSLEVIGEWWSLLIIRDAFRGLRRFESFQTSLGIARNMLSRRLKALVAAGILEKRPYSERPPEPAAPRRACCASPGCAAGHRRPASETGRRR